MKYSFIISKKLPLVPFWVTILFMKNPAQTNKFLADLDLSRKVYDHLEFLTVFKISSLNAKSAKCGEVL